MNQLMLTVMVWLVTLWPCSLYGDRSNWLSFQSGGFKIIQRYGLPEGERLTITLYPLAAHGETIAVDWFYNVIESDIPRLGEVISHYQMEITAIPGLTVLTTMRRCRDRLGEQALVHYQAYYFEHQQRMWIARTELNDNLKLLIQSYGEQLSLVLKAIGTKSNKQ
jgi:hypothetical protein